MSSPSMLIPITIHDDKNDILEQSCSRAWPSTIRSWGHVPIARTGIQGELSEGGCALGTHEGTMFLFSQTSKEKPVPESRSFILAEPRTPSRPSTPLSPLQFNLNQRARVVSGVTTEQVEAPRNYVDFEEEPEKLKDILQGKQPKDTRERSGTPVEAPKITIRQDSPTPSIAGSSHSSITKTLLSATNSATFVTGTARPYSPREFGFENPNILDLRCHVILPHIGPGARVTRIRPIEDNQKIVVLQEQGALSIISVQDGACLATGNASGKYPDPPSGLEDKDSVQTLWFWNYLKVYELHETTLLIASATINSNSPTLPFSDVADEDVYDKSHISIFQVHLHGLDVALEKIGQWLFDGPSYSIGLYQESDNSLKLFHLSTKGHFLSRDMHVLPHGHAQTEIQHSGPSGKDHTNINIPNPFKVFKPHPPGHLSSDVAAKVPGRIVCGDVEDLGEVLPGETIIGFHARGTRTKTLGVAWSEQHLTVFEYQNGSLRVLFINPMSDIQDIQWTTDSSYTILYEDRAECYELHAVDADNDEVQAENIISDKRIVAPRIQNTITIANSFDAIDITSASQILLTTHSESGDRKLVVYDTSPEQHSSSISWQARRSKAKERRESEVSALLPLELDVIIQGFADGHLRRSSLIEMIGNSSKTASSSDDEDLALDGFIASLHLVTNERTKEQFIVGGADDGSVAFWTLDQLKMCARWTLFTTNMTYCIKIQETEASPLKGCVLCISADGTIAVIVVDGFQFLYLVPGSSAPLQRICVGGDNLLLVYADNRARLWDVKTQEFWRSMAEEKVEDLLNQGGWTEIALNVQPNLQNALLKPLPYITLPDTSSTLLLELEAFVSTSMTVAKAISTNRDQTRAILLTLERLRHVLSALLTPGLNRDIDIICTEKLNIRPVTPLIGFSRNEAVTLYPKADPREAWCLSTDVSAARALSITVMLNALSVYEEFMEGASTVMIFYATSLAAVVGPKYQPPSLVYLARRWFDGSSDIRRSARSLFDYAIACISDGDSNEVIEHWQHHLPCLQPTAEREAIQAALSLFLCGHIAAEKYSLLSASTLTDISKSIAMYLHDGQSLHRVLAIDLCSRGFHIWQHYIDAMEILRALFTLSTSIGKDSISLYNVAPQARLAVLQIASANTPLFMTTLGLDILTPPTLDHRKAVMQIFAFLVKKRPLVLQPNLPKLMEAVVRSLDPNTTTHREAVLDLATEIISYVVKNFPTVDFSMTTQRLAVGSNEGAVVMYDLKTAIRLYVLEGHKKAISACSFSPDGRRLLTLSIEESVALVWKVGSSFASFFNPGAPPRQGHGDSQPYKTISFNVGEEAKMTAQESLNLIRISWVADRSVKIQIRDSVLTFST